MKLDCVIAVPGGMRFSAVVLPASEVRTALTASSGAQISPSTYTAVSSAERQISTALAAPRQEMAYFFKNVSAVKSAARRGPRQWRNWWWFCLAAQVMFIPLGLSMRGGWRRPQLANQTEAPRCHSFDIADTAPIPAVRIVTRWPRQG